jgi:hypothetical protein
MLLAYELGSRPAPKEQCRTAGGLQGLCIRQAKIRRCGFLQVVYILACSCMIETKDPESFPQTLVVSSSRELACRLSRLSDPKTILRGYRAVQNRSCVVAVLSGKLTSEK